MQKGFETVYYSKYDFEFTYLLDTLTSTKKNDQIKYT